MSSHCVQGKATCGRRVTGPGIGTTAITSGCRERGYLLRRLVISGLRPGGDGAVSRSCSMKAIGDRVSGSTAGLTMATDTRDADIMVGAGNGTVSTTTAA